MTSELSFLVDLFLKHQLPTEARAIVAERLQALADAPTIPTVYKYSGTNHNPPILSQVPSTQAILDRNPDLAAVLVPPAPVAIVAQTQATVAAMNSRQQAIAESMSGKVDKVTGRPRKF